MKARLPACYGLSFTMSIVQVLHMPLLSIYGLSLGLEASQIGFALSLGSAIYVIVTLLAGVINGKLSPAKTMILSSTFLAVTYLVAPHAKDIAGFALLSCAASFSYGLFWPSVEAIIASMGGSASLFSFSWSSGTLIGSLASSAIISLSPILFFYYISASLALLSVFQVIYTSRLRVGTEAFSPRVFLTELRGLYRHLRFSLIYASSMGSVLSFYPIIVEEGELPIVYISISLFAIIALRTLIFLIFDKTSLPCKEHIGVSLVSLIAVLPFIRDTLLLALVAGLIGAGQGLLYGVALEETFKRCGSKSVCTGLFEGCIGIGYVIGPLVSGLASVYSLDLALPAVVLVCWLIHLLLVNQKVFIV